MQSMTTYETQYRSAAVLFLVADFMRTGARHACVAARQLHAWHERRRIAAAAFHDFATMGERELRDIGLSRADLHRVAWGEWDRFQEPF
jgi:uncharacterized protein YjiS (DUF1127 family)